MANRSWLDGFARPPGDDRSLRDRPFRQPIRNRAMVGHGLDFGSTNQFRNTALMAVRAKEVVYECKYAFAVPTAASRLVALRQAGPIASYAMRDGFDVADLLC